MTRHILNPTSRFSDRVENYVKYRPGYPPALLDFLKEELRLRSGHVVVDLGSGTGIFAEFLLASGCEVVGVEPNAEMRGAAERRLAGQARFRSIDGSAEATDLPDRSADFVTAAQAFHWFDRDPARAELARILKPEGWAVLVWNDRRTEATAFAKEYEALIHRFSTEYRRVDHKNLTEGEIRQFLSEDGYGACVFENAQELDREGLVGRVASSSYAPNKSHPKYPDMVRDLEEVFARHARLGKVRIEYDVRVYYARGWGSLQGRAGPRKF